ncbi:MAG TPA: alpha/beta hydrolase [Trebonia sp.]|jgi:pimeloyl-ACP methyl ester carboxylesterase
MILKAETDAAAPPAWFTRALSVPVTEHVTAVDGVPVAYRMWGSSPNGRGIVLVHGGGAHSRWWDHIGPLLAADRRVIAIDLSGHGDSGRRESYSFDAWAREVLAVAADAGLDAPTVIGHSLGGVVTLRVAALAGSRIEGAVVIDSPVRNPAPEQQAAQERRVFRELRVYPSREAAIARFRPVPDQPVLGYIADHVAAASVRQADGGWTWKWDPRIFVLEPPRAPLTRLDCRVALFRAEHGIMSAEMSEIMYDRLGRVAPLIEIPAAGHHIMLDQPIALAAALRTLLSDWDHSLPAGPRDAAS